MNLFNGSEILREKGYIAAPEAAKMLGISTDALYQSYAATGKLKVQGKMSGFGGRAMNVFLIADVEALLDLITRPVPHSNQNGESGKRSGSICIDTLPMGKNGDCDKSYGFRTESTAKLKACADKTGMTNARLLEIAIEMLHAAVFMRENFDKK